MTAGARFVLDANVFIQAHRAYYAFDVCPGYWKALLAHHDGARLCSVDRIRGELLAGKDALADWVTHTVPEALFANTDDPAITGWFGQMMTWVQSRPQFSAAAKAEFATKADGWLVCVCKGVRLHRGDARDRQPEHTAEGPDPESLRRLRGRVHQHIRYASRARHAIRMARRIT